MDLGAVLSVAGVVTQGRKDECQYVKSYQVKTSLDGITWSDVDGGKVFNGNTGCGDAKVSNRFSQIVQRRYVRIVAKTWHEYVMMRSAVLLCEDNTGDNGECLVVLCILEEPT